MEPDFSANGSRLLMKFQSFHWLVQVEIATTETTEGTCFSPAVANFPGDHQSALIMRNRSPNLSRVSMSISQIDQSAGYIAQVTNTLSYGERRFQETDG